MRFSVVEEIYNAAIKNPDLYFITGDLGHAKTKEFQTDLKDQYFNGGMAEQNIVGVASGLALCGKKAFVYSITPFITLRCIEQIKVDVCDHNLDVTVVGVGGGFAYGSAGVTHYSIEEVSAFRAMPNMKIVCPANPMETRQLTQEIIRLGGPAYIRIGRGKEADPTEPYTVQFGKAHVMRPGGDATIITSGTITTEAMIAAEILEKQGVGLEVLNMHTIKPLDVAAIEERAKTGRPMFTLEEHNILGGLGGAVAEVISEYATHPRVFKRFGVTDSWPEVVGTEEYLRSLYGLSGAQLAEQIKKSI